MFHYQRVLQPSATFVAEIWDIWLHVAMDQYQLIPFLVGWTSIYQLFWCSPGVQGFDTLPYESYWVCKRDPIRPTSETSDEPNIRWRWRRRHWKILFRWRFNWRFDTCHGMPWAKHWVFFPPSHHGIRPSKNGISALLKSFSNLSLRHICHICHINICHMSMSFSQLIRYSESHMFHVWSPDILPSFGQRGRSNVWNWGRSTTSPLRRWKTFEVLAACDTAYPADPADIGPWWLGNPWAFFLNLEEWSDVNRCE